LLTLPLSPSGLLELLGEIAAGLPEPGVAFFDLRIRLAAGREAEDELTAGPVLHLQDVTGAELQAAADLGGNDHLAS
jgi:hypothetical protein